MITFNLHQIRIIKNCHKFLNTGAVIIIKDIFKYRKDHEEINYYKKLKNFIINKK